MAITTITEFVTALQKQAGAQQADIAGKMLKGIADPNEYWKDVGRSQGIGLVADLAYQLMKRRDLDEDDKDLPEMDPPPVKKKAAGGRR
jgi:hypothetical protein